MDSMNNAAEAFDSMSAEDREAVLAQQRAKDGQPKTLDQLKLAVSAYMTDKTVSDEDVINGTLWLAEKAIGALIGAGPMPESLECLN